MNSLMSPQGREPAQVYWVRRGVVLAVALVLVIALALLVTHIGGGSKPGKANVTASQKKKQKSSPSPSSSSSPTPSKDPSSSPSATVTGSADPSESGKGDNAVTAASPPKGTCKDSEVVLTPKVRKLHGGQTVRIPIAVTSTGDACTWRVSAKSVVAKITSGKDRIWSSQDCPAAITNADVIARPQGEKQARVFLTWSGRRSADQCPKGTQWSRPGDYHLVAAAMGGTPSDVQFKVVKPPRPVVTKTAKPKNHKHGKKAATKPGREN